MYTYAFLQTPTVPFDLPSGIVGALELVSETKLSALVEPDLAVEDLQNGDRQLMQAVLAHDRIIRELFEQTAVLPLRFGTRFVSEHGLREHLQRHQVEYLNQLNHLKDKAEYLLKLTPIALTEDDAPSKAKGRAYFLAKKERYQTQALQQQQQQAELQQMISAIAEQHPNWVQSQPQDGVERIYILGDRQNPDSLRRQIEMWRTQVLYWTFSLSEALPPYHFV